MKTKLKNQTVNSNRQLKKLQNKLQQEVQNQKSKHKIYENSLNVLQLEVKSQQNELKRQEKTISNLTAVIKGKVMYMDSGKFNKRYLTLKFDNNSTKFIVVRRVDVRRTIR